MTKKSTIGLIIPPRADKSHKRSRTVLWKEANGIKEQNGAILMKLQQPLNCQEPSPSCPRLRQLPCCVGVHSNVFVKKKDFFIGLIETSEENQLFSSVTELMLFPRQMFKAKDEET